MTISLSELCALALAAIDDVDARVVLADAIEESGVSEDVRMGIINVYWRDPPPDTAYELRPHELARLDRGARAVTAVLLFGGWPTRWELAERCRRTVSVYVSARGSRYSRSEIDEIQRILDAAQLGGADKVPRQS